MIETIYKFGKGIDTGMFDAEVVGGKGAKLAEMGSLDLPVPPGVTITTQQCMNYLNATSTLTQNAIIENLVSLVMYNYADIKDELGYMPLVSVRSGARVSMPGMMDTVLNVGIHENNFHEWADRLGSKDAALDCYSRLIQMYGEVVIGIPAVAFAECSELNDYRQVYEELTGTEFPQTIEEQLAGSIEAVFKSWFSDRAVAYRQIHGYPDDWGTAVNVQTMVFGNRNDKSASGVLFTRDFNTGSQQIVADYLINAQGEDVVAGTTTPESFTYIKAEAQGLSLDSGDVCNELGSCFYELVSIAQKVEAYYRDMQDMEFTIDDGELFILQTRDGKRSAQAAFKIAWDMHMAGTINQAEALARVSGKQYIALHNSSLDPEFDMKPDFVGVAAAGSIVSGIAVLTADDAIKCTEPCILVTKETTPNDFAGMAASVGILTQTGGITSHAAVVARGMNKTCVVGAENLKIGGLDTHAVQAGDKITIDGSTGNIWHGIDVPVIAGEIADHVHEMIGWALVDDASFLTVQPESVPESGFVYIDASAHLQTQKSLTEALKRSKASGATGIIGFGKTEITPEEDSRFLGFFGVETQNYDSDTNVLIEKTLSLKIWTKKMKKAWTVHLPTGASADFVKRVRDAGWKTVTVVKSFKTALTVNGFVQMDEKFLSQLESENMEFNEIEELVLKAGGEVRELPKRISKERLLFDVLGG